MRSPARDVEQAATRNTAFTVFQMVDALAARQLPRPRRRWSRCCTMVKAPVRILGHDRPAVPADPLRGPALRALPKGEAESSWRPRPLRCARPRARPKLYPAQVEHALKACADLDWQIKKKRADKGRSSGAAGPVMDIHIFKE